MVGETVGCGVMVGTGDGTGVGFAVGTGLMVGDSVGAGQPTQLPLYSSLVFSHEDCWT